MRIKIEEVDMFICEDNNINKLLNAICMFSQAELDNMTNNAAHCMPVSIIKDEFNLITIFKN